MCPRVNVLIPEIMIQNTFVTVDGEEEIVRELGGRGEGRRWEELRGDANSTL